MMMNTIIILKTVRCCREATVSIVHTRTNCLKKEPLVSNVPAGTGRRREEKVECFRNIYFS